MIKIFYPLHSNLWSWALIMFESCVITWFEFEKWKKSQRRTSRTLSGVHCLTKQRGSCSESWPTHITLYYTYSTVQKVGEVLWFIMTHWHAAVQMCDQSDAICYLHSTVRLLQVLVCELQEVKIFWKWTGRDMSCSCLVYAERMWNKFANMDSLVFGIRLCKLNVYTAYNY